MKSIFVPFVLFAVLRISFVSNMVAIQLLLKQGTIIRSCTGSAAPRKVVVPHRYA